MFDKKNAGSISFVVILHVLIIMGLVSKPNTHVMEQQKDRSQTTWMSLITPSQVSTSEEKDNHRSYKAQNQPKRTAYKERQHPVKTEQDTNAALVPESAAQTPYNQLPPSSEPINPGHIDLNAAIAGVRGIADEKDDRPVAQLKRVPANTHTPLERFSADVNKSTRADCRNAYAHLGPLIAPIFLVKDAITQNGCKW